MNFTFRDHQPRRTYTVHHCDYHRYKDALASDFSHHCGYTNCSDSWLGGMRCYQIDHFKPYSIYPDKKNDYNNLVYCCSYVNRAKWDDDNDNYLDPCDTDYNEHFRRDKYGVIIPISPKASYMVSRLHLNLQRYAIIWALEQLDLRINRLKKVKSKDEETQKLLFELLFAFHEYTQRLKGNL